MKIDMHAHTSGISWCCDIPFETVLSFAHDIGLDGIVLTNHYAKYYTEKNGPLALAHDYIAEYERTKALGERMGIKVFFGVEIKCHPLYEKSDAARLLHIAASNHLTVTCGGDFHGDTYRPLCATVLPDDVQNEADIARFLLHSEKTELLIHEPLTARPYTHLYHRNETFGKNA